MAFRVTGAGRPALRMEGAAASRGQEQQAEVEVGKPRSTEIKLPKIVLVIFEILFHI